ncbi:MAG: ABC transporter ATP-binding protein [Elusimicrobia bacterium]|nr:ABC transporter ATP-binding protein [Elusimicrobiota bacterium]
MNDKKIILSAAGLCKSFGGRKVLDSLSLEAAEGEVIGILGRNGSGKTTLFKILLDLTAADTGSVTALGLSPDGSGRLRGLIGYVPEKPAFHGFLTVEETLAFRAGFFPAWEAAKAAELCRKLELDPKAKAGGLSKGNTAKLAWICAAAHNPRLLLLDEPTSGLDYLVRDHILNGLVHELAEGGRTIIISNHRMGEMGGLLDRVCVLKDGRISADYSADFIKEEVFRVTLRGTARPPADGVREISRSGSLSELAVFGREKLAALKASGLPDGTEIAPLEQESAFKAMLGE